MQSGFARPIPIPTSQPVIGNRAHARTQHPHLHRPIAGQVREQGSQNHCWANCVDRELPGKPVGIEITQGLFGAARVIVKHSAGDQHERSWGSIQRLINCGCNCFRFLEIAGDGLIASDAPDLPSRACGNGI